MKKVLLTLAILASLLWSQPLEFQLSPESEIDIASECLKFPCYTAEHKEWRSQKYLTKNKVIKPEEWKLKRKRR